MITANATTTETAAAAKLRAAAEALAGAAWALEGGHRETSALCAAAGIRHAQAAQAILQQGRGGAAGTTTDSRAAGRAA